MNMPGKIVDGGGGVLFMHSDLCPLMEDKHRHCATITAQTQPFCWCYRCGGVSMNIDDGVRVNCNHVD